MNLTGGKLEEVDIADALENEFSKSLAEGKVNRFGKEIDPNVELFDFSDNLVRINDQCKLVVFDFYGTIYSYGNESRFITRHGLLDFLKVQQALGRKMVVCTDDLDEGGIWRKLVLLGIDEFFVQVYGGYSLKNTGNAFAERNGLKNFGLMAREHDVTLPEIDFIGDNGVGRDKASSEFFEVRFHQVKEYATSEGDMAEPSVNNINLINQRSVHDWMNTSSFAFNHPKWYVAEETGHGMYYTIKQSSDDSVICRLPIKSEPKTIEGSKRNQLTRWAVNLIVRAPELVDILCSQIRGGVSVGRKVRDLLERMPDSANELQAK